MEERPAWTRIEDDEEYEKAREEAYKAFFGKSWEDIIDLWRVEDATPEEAVDILGDDLDFCDHCHEWYLVDRDDFGVYRCPYCNALGTYSEPDEWNEKLAYYEHEWEARTGR